MHRGSVIETALLEKVLSAAVGGPVTVGPPVPAAAGWTAGFGTDPGVVRCAVSGPPGWDVRSVVVKLRRPDGERLATEAVGRERAALTLLEELGSDAGPRALATDPDFVVLEDLGSGPGLEDLLVGADPGRATTGFVAFAVAVAGLNAVTAGQWARFEALLHRHGVDAAGDRVSPSGSPLAGHWAALEALAAQGLLPATAAAAADVEQVRHRLTDPGPLLVLSSGDIAPQNCRLVGGRVRLLDFEAARFQHALLDAAQLRLPFYGGPCWSRIPGPVSEQVERAYRTELGRSCPDVLDDRSYTEGLAAATAAWTLIRSTRLPKLIARDEPHPLGFSRRGQLLDTLQLAVETLDRSGTLPALGHWFELVIAGLRRRWPGLPVAQPVYPAYR